jgi:hypothetical protein
MENKFVIKRGYVSQGDSSITGSLVVSNGITGSFSGSFQGDGSELTDVTASLAPNYTLTSSFNAFTSSYLTDSSSFDTRILSNSSSIDLLSGSFETFTQTYNTGSFTGSFIGDGSQLNGIVSASFADTSGDFNPGSTSGSFGITIDGAGSTITTGEKGYAIIPYNGTITGWTMIADQSGNCVIDVWKTSSGNIPLFSDTITGTEKPTLSSQQINSDLTLTSWTTGVNAGDVIAFNVDSVSTITRVNLSIYITKQ